MKILITGCNGFIGSNLTIELLKCRWTIVGIDIRKDEDLVRLYKKCAEEYDTSFIFFNEDVCNTDVLNGGYFDVVCHLAASTGVRRSLEYPTEYIKNNVYGHTHILKECVKNGNVPLVYASSSSVYGKSIKYPYTEDDDLNDGVTSIYALTKKMCEETSRLFFELHGQPSIGLRFFTVYGPRGRSDMAPRKFLHAIKSKIPIIRYGSGEDTFRDYTFISDIISGIKLSINDIYDNTNQCEIYNLGKGSPISLNNFIKECETIVGNTADIKEEKLHIADVKGTYADISKAKNKLKYNPIINIKEGLQITMEWMNSDIVLTCYFTSKKDPQSKIIQPPNSYDYIKPWYSTMKEKNINGLIFHDGLSKEFVNKYTTKTIRFQYVDISQYERDSLNDIRFYVYHDFLLSEKGSNIKRLYMTDVTDVFIGKDPFKTEFDESKIYAGKDVEMIRTNRWINNKLKPISNALNFKKISHRHLLNAGVVGGCRKIIIRFLDMMIKTFNSLKNTKDNANMCVFNYVCWTYFSTSLIYGVPVTSDFRKYQTSRKDVFFIHK